MCFHRVNIKREPKDRAITSISYPHQGKMFHPAMGWVYWIRYGDFLFDIREVRKYYGKQEHYAVDWKVSQAAFCEKITDLLKLTNGIDFMSVLKEIYKGGRESSV